MVEKSFFEIYEFTGTDFNEMFKLWFLGLIHM